MGDARAASEGLAQGGDSSLSTSGPASASLFLRGEVWEHALLAPARGGLWGLEGASSYLQAFARYVKTERARSEDLCVSVSLRDWVEFNRTCSCASPAELGAASASPHRLTSRHGCADASLDEEELHVFWQLFVSVLRTVSTSLSFLAPSEEKGTRETSSARLRAPTQPCSATSTDAAWPNRDSSSPVLQTALERSLASSRECVDLRALALLLLIQESRSLRLPVNPRSTDDPWRSRASGATDARDFSGGASAAGAPALGGGARGESPRYLSRESGPHGIADESRLRVFLQQSLPVLLQTVVACSRELEKAHCQEDEENVFADSKIGSEDWISAEEVEVFSLLFACADGGSVVTAFSRSVSEPGATDDAKRKFEKNAFLVWLKRRLAWNDRLYPSRQSLAGSCALFYGAKRSQQFERVFVVAEAHGRRLVIDRESLGTTQPRDRVLIINCSECDIFLNAPVSSVKMVSCSNSSLMCGRPVDGILSLYNTQRLEVHAAAFLIQACNTLDAQLFVCSASPPLLCGDTRGIVLAPLDIPLSLQDLQREGRKGEQSRRKNRSFADDTTGETDTDDDDDEEVFLFGRPLSWASTAFAFPLSGGGCGSCVSALSSSSAFPSSSPLSSSSASPALPVGEGSATRCSSAGGRSIAGTSQIFQLLNPKHFNPISMPRPAPRRPHARVASDVSQNCQDSRGSEKETLEETKTTNENEKAAASAEADREEGLLALPEDFAEALFEKQKEVESIHEMMENLNLTDQQRETFFQILALML
ncbi:tubulin-binding cofactor C, partial [Toxoplasma gondii ARI]